MIASRPRCLAGAASASAPGAGRADDAARGWWQPRPKALGAERAVRTSERRLRLILCLLKAWRDEVARRTDRSWCRAH